MIEVDALTIREEPFAEAWADSAALRADHEAEVGGARAGVTFNPNVALMEKLDSVGALLTTTVRSNGRMFAYALSIISPSLESPDHVQGQVTALFVDKAMRGIGPRLLRETVEMMRRRGVREVILRAGVRGSGPKAGALYRRMGAVPMGEMFGLMLEGA